MLARPDAPEVRERHDEADRTMTTHAEVTDVVEVDHARRAGGICRIDEQSPDQHVRTARLVDDGRAKTIVLGSHALQSNGQWAASQVRSTADHDPSGLAAGVGVDHLDSPRLSHE